MWQHAPKGGAIQQALLFGGCHQHIPAFSFNVPYHLTDESIICLSCYKHFLIIINNVNQQDQSGVDLYSIGPTRTWVTFPGSRCHSSEGQWLGKLKGSAWSLCSLMYYELLMFFSCEFVVVIFWQLEHGTQPTFVLYYSQYVYFSSYQFGDDWLRKLEMAPVDISGTQTQLDLIYLKDCLVHSSYQNMHFCLQCVSWLSFAYFNARDVCRMWLNCSHWKWLMSVL